MIVYPFDGTFKVTSTFGKTRTYKNRYEQWITDKHEGIDLVGISDKTVVSATEGIVGFVKNSGSSGYGLHVWVINDDGTGSLYGHLSSINVSKGQSLRAGTKIGIMGQSGNSTGPHLHFEVHTSTEYKYAQDLIDPAIYLNLSYDQLGGKIIKGGKEVSTIENVTLASDGTYTSGLLDTVVTDGSMYRVTGEGSYGNYALYGRKYRVLVSDINGNSINVSNLRCKFEVTKVSYYEPNYIVVTIYNMTAATENQMISSAYYVVIEAGYDSGNHYGLIFKGQVVQPIRGKENGTDYFLKLVCIDNVRYMTYATMCNTFVANQTMRDTVNMCITNPTNVELKTNPGTIEVADIVYPRGKVLFGSAATYLEEAARSSNCTFYFDADKANIVSALQPPQGQAISLTPESGLIGTPSQIVLSTGGIGVTAKCLLNPMISPGSMIHLDNSRIQAMQYDFTKNANGYRPLDNEGLYRVIRVVHTGDTRGDEWYSEFEAISQAGALPGVMSTEAMYPW